MSHGRAPGFELPELNGRLRQAPAPFLTAAVRAFRAHQRDGDGVVLVSGSLQSLVAPIAEDLDADWRSAPRSC